MCIVLLTTSHPDYALIIVDNRDEFILRPTSRPHWWKPSAKSNGTHAADAAPNGSANGTPPLEAEVLSSRDLQRAEQGTWLGITRHGNFAVLTNYREGGPEHPSVAGARSRGAIVNAWLGADPKESSADFVARMVDSGDTKAVGGFSLICGKLRPKAGGKAETKSGEDRSLAPLAIISNRHETVEAVPWICGRPGEVHGLSNAIYVHPDEVAADEPLWPKVVDGTRLLKEAVDAAIRDSASEEDLVTSLFKVLDHDKLPMHEDMKFEDYIEVLKESIFIPPVGDEKHRQEMEAAVRNGEEGKPGAAATLTSNARPDNHGLGFMTGLYGTQRQTVILLDWDGNVTYKERALWDANGNPLERGKGDMTFTYKIEGWEAD